MENPQPTHHILWVDDEIDLLKPHILFLQAKGYDVTPVISGSDAVEMLRETPDHWDLALLDENMPGLTGLETLDRFHLINPELPVVMITKSEEENLMDQAVGNQIKDYLIKPVNPNQILLTLKKLLHAPRLATQQASVNYRREFMEISDMTARADSFEQWCEIYRRLAIRFIDFSQTAPDIEQLLKSQYREAQTAFFKFVRSHYLDWIEKPEHAPVMSHRVLNHAVKPLLDAGKKAALLVLDNFRLDQWLSIKNLFTEHFDITGETLACAILPTATQYARNALFSGLLPAQIERLFPDLWIDEDDERSKNLNEEPLVQHWLDRNCSPGTTLSFHKANNSAQLNRVIRDIGADSANLVVVVVNVIDIISHAKTDSRMVRELASTDAAYRSLTQSWARHSPFTELLEKMARAGRTCVFTTDHGSIRVDKAIKVKGEKETNTALRYKLGRNLAYPAKEVYEILRPAQAGLPAPNLSTAYIFAGENNFFAYPNNYNYYVKYYTDTYQHGGVSFEEMILPLVTLTPKA